MSNQIIALLMKIEAQAKLTRDKAERRQHWERELYEEVCHISNDAKQLLNLISQDKNR